MPPLNLSNKKLSTLSPNAHTSFFKVDANQMLFITFKQMNIINYQRIFNMKAFIILLTTLGLATAVWAGNHGGKLEGKHHFSKMTFKKMDTDNDGAISVREHEAGLQEMMDRRRAHFARMDIDGDGILTKEEAKKARKGMGEKRKERKQENMSN